MIPEQSAVDVSDCTGEVANNKVPPLLNDDLMYKFLSTCDLAAHYETFKDVGYTNLEEVECYIHIF